MSKVFITDYIENPDIEENVLGKIYREVDYSKIEVLLVWHKKIDNDYLKLFPNLKGVVRYGVGYDNIDLTAMKKRNLIFCNNPDYGVQEVSDTVIAFAMMFSRGILAYNNLVKKIELNTWQENIIKNIKRINKLSFGVIGAGRIGSLVLLKAQALGFKTIFFDPHKDAGYEKVLNSRRVETLNSLIEISDIISINTPLNETTKSLVNKSFVEKMKKDSFFINAARGSLVEDIDIFYNRLFEGSLGGIALDVLPEEPPDYSSKILSAWKDNHEWAKSKIIINPHTSYYSLEAFEEMRSKAAYMALSIINNTDVKNRII